MKNLQLEFVTLFSKRKIRSISSFIDFLQTESGNKWLESLPGYATDQEAFVIKAANSFFDHEYRKLSNNG